ncbi:MAG: hypothetical protein LBB79_01035 [Prevotellaceae bacterium]|jgi:hypothetical protein|nr:hypothetical protein [Prevotellaceae bacterium]
MINELTKKAEQIFIAKEKNNPLSLFLHEYDANSEVYLITEKQDDGKHVNIRACR